MILSEPVAGIPEPELALCFGAFPTLAGLLPWHTRWTEILYAFGS